MNVELLRATTADGVRLDGALHLPAAEPPAAAVLWLHGTGANFYGSSLAEALISALTLRGLAVLAVNTRGHDLLATLSTSDGPRPGGAAYEIVDDCRHDVAAWLEVLADRTPGRLIVAGHSLGGLKAIYAAAHGTARPLAGVAAVSPPRLAQASLAAGPRGGEFLADLAEAQRRVAAGSQELMAIRFPIPYLIAPPAYLDKYGPDERYNLIAWLPRVDCPVLVTYGGREQATAPGFSGVAEAVEALDPTRMRIRVEVLADADHFYIAARDELAARLLRWIDRLGAVA